MFLSSLQAIFILLSLIMIGIYLVSKKVLPLKVIDVISPLVIEVSVPALVFFNIITKFNPNNFKNWYVMPLWWITYTLVILFMLLILSKFIKSKEFIISMLYPNSIFIPLAIIPVLFPDSNMLIELFIFTLFSPMFVFNSYFYFFKQNMSFNWKKFLNPIFLATVSSILFVLLGIKPYIPNLIIKISSMLGALALPLVMIMIGANIYIDFKRKGKLNTKLIISFLFFRNIFFPSIILFLLYFIKLENNLSFLIFLLTIVPPLTAIPILVSRVKGDVSLANQFVVFSLLFSALTIPIWLSIFNQIFKII